jgi:hypothetical protein
MKVRFLYIIALACSLELAATAQNTIPQEPNRAALDSTAQVKQLPLLTYVDDLPPYLVDESSLQNSYNTTSQDDPNTASLPTAPAQAAPATSTTPCEIPTDLFAPADYRGPLERVAAWISRRPEMTTVPTRRKSGTNVCALDVRQKFHLFTETTIDPLNFLIAGVAAGISQGLDVDSDFGQGAEGYGKRYAAAITDITQVNFFGKFFYPAIFRQDPRYYRRGEGPISKRIGHALTHAYHTRGDSGRQMLNYSLWATTASSIAIGNLYHPDNERGFVPATEQVFISIGTSMGFDLLREFWPETVRALRLPFRDRTLVPVSTPTKP